VGEGRGEYRSLVEKPEGKRPLGRPRHRWEDNMKKGLQDVGCGGMDGLIWPRIGGVVGNCKRGNEPSFSIKCGEFID
jgi:hypothetical protein